MSSFTTSISETSERGSFGVFSLTDASNTMPDVATGLSITVFTFSSGTTGQRGRMSGRFAGIG